MDNPSAETDGAAPRPRAALPITVTAWLAVAALCWFVPYSRCSTDCHHLSVTTTRILEASMTIAVVVFMIGPLVSALVAFWLNRNAVGFAFLAITAAVGVLTLSSETAVYFLTAPWA